MLRPRQACSLRSAYLSLDPALHSGGGSTPARGRSSRSSSKQWGFSLPLPLENSFPSEDLAGRDWLKRHLHENVVGFNSSPDAEFAERYTLLGQHIPSRCRGLVSAKLSLGECTLAQTSCPMLGLPREPCLQVFLKKLLSLFALAQGCLIGHDRHFRAGDPWLRGPLVCWRMSSNMPGICPPDASLVGTTQNVSRCVTCLLGAKSPPARTTGAPEVHLVKN